MLSSLLNKEMKNGCLSSHCGVLVLSWTWLWNSRLHVLSGLLGAVALLESPDRFVMFVVIGDNKSPILALVDEGDVAKTWSVPGVMG